jgi:hypothetical protein
MDFGSRTVDLELSGGDGDDSGSEAESETFAPEPKAKASKAADLKNTHAAQETATPKGGKTMIASATPKASGKTPNNQIGTPKANAKEVAPAPKTGSKDTKASSSKMVTATPSAASSVNTPAAPKTGQKAANDRAVSTTPAAKKAGSNPSQTPSNDLKKGVATSGKEKPKAEPKAAAKVNSLFCTQGKTNIT